MLGSTRAAVAAGLPRLFVHAPAARTTGHGMIVPSVAASVCSSLIRHSSALAAASGTLRFVPGFFEFTFTLPQDGADQRLVVAVPHTATVATATAMLEGAGAAALEGVAVLGRDQTPLPPSTSLHAALQDQGEVFIGSPGAALAVPVPSFTGGAYGVQSAASGYHRLNVREVMQKGAFVRTRRRLQALARRTITWDAFLEIAEDNGVTRGEAEELSAALHTAGVILHFRNHPDGDIRNTVFLQPDDVIDSVFQSFDLEGPVGALADAERTKQREQLKRITGALASRQAAKAVVDANAARTAKMFNVGVLASYTGMMGFMMTMTYSVLSWDIIEPVTWALGQGAVISGYGWWLLTRKDMEFENMSGVVADWTRRRQSRTAAAPEAGDALVDVLGPKAGSGGDLDADIAALKEAEVRCRSRLELLSITRYSPALTSVYDTLTLPAGSAIMADAAAVTSSTSDDAEATVARVLAASR